MARSTVTPTTVTEAGIDPAAVAVAANTTDGDAFAWRAHRLLYVANGDDAEITVTIATAATVGRSALAVADQSVTIAAGGAKLMGPFGPEYRQADGSVHVDYAGTTPASVTVAVLDA
ncbi:MAG TPA: hypothetical protein VIS06_07310 [Mycobacteriales bacterium]